MIAIGDSFDSSSSLLHFSYHTTNAPALSRYQGKANVVFCDGHVESPTLNFFLKTPATPRWFAGIVTICRIVTD